LPKAGTAQRLGGASLEWFIYQFGCGLIAVLSASTFGLADAIIAIPLALLIAIRDAHSGLFSIEKRLGRMRVVKFDSGEPISNVDAFKRNSYLLLMPIGMALPIIALDALLLTLFEFMVLVDVLMIVFRSDGRRLGDLLAGTQVVRATPREQGV